MSSLLRSVQLVTGYTMMSLRIQLLILICFAFSAASCVETAPSHPLSKKESSGQLPTDEDGYATNEEDAVINFGGQNPVGIPDAAWRDDVPEKDPDEEKEEEDVGEPEDTGCGPFNPAYPDC